MPEGRLHRVHDRRGAGVHEGAISVTLSHPPMTSRSGRSPADRDRLTHAIKHELAQRIWGEQAARISKHGYPSLFANSPQPMWIYDVKTLRILDVNQAALERYGYSRDEFLGLTIKDIRPREDVPKFLELIADVPRSDRTGPWRHVLRDGTIIQVLITSHAVEFGEHTARLVMAENLAEDPDLDVD
ncbi:PAS domain S-box protein [bacterium]|nr:MAG: PAS domain S-box protein [bacterium]